MFHSREYREKDSNIQNVVETQKGLADSKHSNLGSYSIELRDLGKDGRAIFFSNMYQKEKSVTSLTLGTDRQTGLKSNPISDTSHMYKLGPKPLCHVFFFSCKEE